MPFSDNIFAVYIFISQLIVAAPATSTTQTFDVFCIQCCSQCTWRINIYIHIINCIWRNNFSTVFSCRRVQLFLVDVGDIHFCPCSVTKTNEVLPCPTPCTITFFPFRSSLPKLSFTAAFQSHKHSICGTGEGSPHRPYSQAIL